LACPTRDGVLVDSSARRLIRMENGEPSVNVVEKNTTTYTLDNIESDISSFSYQVRLQFVAIRNFIMTDLMNRLKLWTQSVPGSF
jgi:hypothetical protein